MKTSHTAILGAAALVHLVACTTPPAQDLPTTGRVESRLGTIELENGYPTAATAAKIFDDIDYQRACQAYLWALPLMAMQQWQNEHQVKFAAGKRDYVDYLTFEDKLGLLTANATTPYVMAFPNLKETGPLVFEVPAGPTAGGLPGLLAAAHHRLGSDGARQGLGRQVSDPRPRRSRHEAGRLLRVPIADGEHLVRPPRA